jgi:hypothetical protein
MSDSLLEEETLTTADIANPPTPRQARAEAGDNDIVQAESKDQSDPQPIERAAIPAVNDAGPLFPDDELHNFRVRWDQVQASFVDEPRKAVEQADSLVANLVKRIAEQFAGQRATLEGQWGKGDDVSTEDLRQALRRYRSFFDRLLSF